MTLGCKEIIPKCKAGNVRFTTVPLKEFIIVLLYKSDIRISTAKKNKNFQN